jgi:hypothetical protein
MHIQNLAMISLKSPVIVVSFHTAGTHNKGVCTMCIQIVVFYHSFWLVTISILQESIIKKPL